MMNELLELELWRIIGLGNDESGGGYSGGGRGSLVHKSCAKRTLYLVVAVVVVEQDMAVMENLCQHSEMSEYEAPHELDDGWVVARRWVLTTWRDIISNVLCVLLLGGLDEAVLRREPKVPSQSSHIGPGRDYPSPMSLHLMADGEGDEVGKGWGEDRCLRAARIIGGQGRDEVLPAL
ncbi:hypothetical protein GOBAR_AA11640 [Gossypium barbadense]|uniref:Uncharacterized protein n=1 Tax=Gossypium barbadense TaxID=3634 RepID=A0A2P5Y093_GOSBA|nr:hypothetical protein GOBAR_AA11640 [Gossypium barbadense]